MALRALVTGATGYVGSRVVGALVDAGYAVVATGRSGQRLASFDWPEPVVRRELDVRDPDACRAVLDDVGHVDVVYYLVHVVGDDDFAAKDQESARVLAAASSDAAVGRIVYLGGLVPPGEDLSEHLRSRAVVGDELGDHGVDLVWLRAAIILGAGSASYEFVRQLVERLPVVPVPTFMDAPVQPIAVTDVLDYLVLAGGPAVPAGVYDIAGPEQISYSQLVQQVASASDISRRLVSLPWVTAAMAAPVVARLTQVPTPMVDDLVHSLRNDMRADDTSILALRDPSAPPLLTVAVALARAHHRPATLDGVSQTNDPLQLASTDARWARSTH